MFENLDRNREVQTERSEKEKIEITGRYVFNTSSFFQ